MTETGQIPAGGLPEHADDGVASGPAPGPDAPQAVHAPGAHAYPDTSAPHPTADDQLLMPGSQGPWGESQPGGVAAQGEWGPQETVPGAQEVPPGSQEPAAGPHESAGRHAGASDQRGARAAGRPVSARRPLHLGPTSPTASSAWEAPPSDPSPTRVRTLADRGPAGAPSATPPGHRGAGAAPAGPSEPSAPEAAYPPPAIDDPNLAGPQLSTLPPHEGVPWSGHPPEGSYAPSAETVPAAEAVAADAARQTQPETAADPQAAPGSVLPGPQAQLAAEALPGAGAPGEIGYPVDATQPPQDMTHAQYAGMADQAYPEGADQEGSAGYVAPQGAEYVAADGLAADAVQADGFPANGVAETGQPGHGDSGHGDSGHGELEHGELRQGDAGQGDFGQGNAGQQAQAGALPAGSFEVQPLPGAEAPGVRPGGVPDGSVAFPAAGGDAQPVGQFVPVDGYVPTTPHLAPAPPHEQSAFPHPVAETAVPHAEPSAHDPVARPCGAEASVPQGTAGESAGVVPPGGPAGVDDVAAGADTSGNVAGPAGEPDGAVVVTGAEGAAIDVSGPDGGVFAADGQPSDPVAVVAGTVPETVAAPPAPAGPGGYPQEAVDAADGPVDSAAAPGADPGTAVPADPAAPHDTDGVPAPEPPTAVDPQTDQMSSAEAVVADADARSEQVRPMVPAPRDGDRQVWASGAHAAPADVPAVPEVAPGDGLPQDHAPPQGAWPASDTVPEPAPQQPEQLPATSTDPGMAPPAPEPAPPVHGTPEPALTVPGTPEPEAPAFQASDEETPDPAEPALAADPDAATAVPDAPAAVPDAPAAVPDAPAVAPDPAASAPVASRLPDGAASHDVDVADATPHEADAGEASAPEPQESAAPQHEPPTPPAPGAGEVSPAADAAQPEPASAGAPAAGYDAAERAAVMRVMRERRDIRNGFRRDPIPHEVLLRVLEAAHTAPSVGHSQPWDFVVIRSEETRRTMHELAMRQREAYAKSLPKGRAKQFRELKVEAILDTPVNIVVTADPTRGGRHTLGRHTQPQMAPYSSALAVENLWLAARAEGLGVGWVSFFDEREMVRTLDLPEHLHVVAYLCVGYVDAFPDEPELMQAGWSKRRPLSWVVHEETYGRRALPGAEPHDLLAETIGGIRPLDAKALGAAWERQKRMTKPAGALGMLEIISAQLSGLSRMCPPPVPEPAAVAIFAGDHGVHAQGVTPWPQEVTSQMVANFLGGGAVCNAFANQVGAEVCVVDVGVAAELPATPGLLPRKVRAGTADMTAGPALTREEVKAAIEVGIETARDLVAAGNKALLTGEMGIANTTVSAALIAVFTGVEPAEVTGRGTGISDETLVRKTEVVRRALELHQPDPADPIGVLAAVGGLEHAAMAGLLLGGASLRTPVVLDGVSAGAAALVARAIAPEVLAACIAGHRSAEPGHAVALTTLGLRPLIDLDLRLGEGTGALLALPLIQSAARAMHEVATFDAAGVTEK